MSSLRLALPRRDSLESGVAALVAVVIAGLVFFQASGSASSYYSESGGCIVRDADTFERMLSTADTLAVMFSSDTCPVCKVMEPSWVKLCRSPPEGVRVSILKLSRSTLSLFERYSVTETPTFIVFIGGQPSARHVGAFSGGNVTQAMEDWILQATRPIGAGDLDLARKACSSCHALPRGLDRGSVEDWIHSNPGDPLAAAVAAAASMGGTVSQLYGGRGQLVSIIMNMTGGLSPGEAYRIAALLDSMALTLAGEGGESGESGGEATPLKTGPDALLLAGPLAALLAGLIASLSPCVFPLLVSYTASLASGSRGARIGSWDPVKAFAAAAAGAVGVGAVFVALGEAVARVSGILLPTAALTLAAAGLLELLGVPTFVNVSVRAGRGLVSFTLLYGILAVQCSFPLVAGALLLVASGGVEAGLPALAGFALGISAPVGLAVWAATTGRLGGLASRVSSEAFRRYANLALTASGVFLLAYSIGLA